MPRIIVIKPLLAFSAYICAFTYEWESIKFRFKIGPNIYFVQRFKIFDLISELLLSVCSI